MISEREMMIVDAVNYLEAVGAPDNECTTIYSLGGGRVCFGRLVTDRTTCLIDEYTQCIHEMSEGSFVPNARKAVKAKTATVKVMLFDKHYEFTVCYYTETFELVSAFENKMNQSVMWSQPIKDLIVNELKNGVDELSRITHDDKFPLYHSYRDNVNAQRELRG